jgi:hypothetical protein
MFLNHSCTVEEYECKAGTDIEITEIPFENNEDIMNRFKII